MHAMHSLSSVAIQPNLELKTRPKQLLGSLPLDIVLPDYNEESIWLTRYIYSSLNDKADPCLKTRHFFKADFF
jgi:hypothetical protein